MSPYESMARSPTRNAAPEAATTAAPTNEGTSVPALLAEIVRRIRAVSDPEQIILFGSYARGDFGPDSDLDLLVVERGVESPRRESVRLRRALRGLLVPIDVVVATPRQIRRHRNSIGLIYNTAVREGKVLYERTATS